MFGKGEREERKEKEGLSARRAAPLGERSSPSFVSSVYHNPDN